VENGTVVFVPENVLHMGESEIFTPAPVADENVFESNRNNFLSESERTEADSLKLTVSVMTYVWLFGILCMSGYSIISIMRLKKRLVGAVKLEDNIWIADHIYTSFVMGIFCPQIYLQSGLSQREQEFVIRHEKIHIKRCDYLVKLCFWLVLTVHWFNPLVWLSYVLCIKDMEMSCDESVMKNMEEDVRADYSQSLLSLATGRKLFAGTPLFFGEGDIKSRIKNVLNYKKPTMWVIMAGVIISVILCACFMGNPANDTLSDKQKRQITECVKDMVPDVNEKTILIKTSEQNYWNYPSYPVYVRTMGPGSIGCEYGYCARGEQSESEILKNLEKMDGFHFNNNYNEDVALFYSDEPQEIKFYHALAGNEEYEEYAFAGGDYDYLYGAEGEKYVIRVPETYGVHYFFAVISWADGREDFMYFSMEYKYNPPSEADYNLVTIAEKEPGITEIKYQQLNFLSQTMESFPETKKVMFMW